MKYGWDRARFDEARVARRGARFLIAALLFAAVRVAPAAGPALPAKPTRYVTDRTGTLPADRASALNEKLAAFERETSSQVLVYIDERIPEGTTLEEFSSRAIREWGVGQKGKSNGVIFFLFTGDRKMRLEVGYGLEGALPDALAHRIDDEVFKPRLQANDVAGAMDAGTDAILGVLRGEPYKGTGRTAAESGRAGAAPRRASGFLAFLPLIFFGGFFFLVVVIVVAARRARGGLKSGTGGWTSSTSGSSSGWSSSSGSSSSSSDSSSSSSSDFSGGGGDGGGGGSSDSY